jgi:hypothetical protein
MIGPVSRGTGADPAGDLRADDRGVGLGVQTPRSESHPLIFEIGPI